MHQISQLNLNIPKTSSTMLHRRWLWLLLASVLSFLFSLHSYGFYILYPFKLFTTWVHESGHALMTLLVGGSVQSLSIASDTSGLTQSLIPQSSSRIAQGLISSAGYLGASVFGCILLAATRATKITRILFLFLAMLMFGSVVLWVRDGFTFLIVVVLGLLLFLVSRKRQNAWSNFLLSLLAVQVALNAIFDLRVLFLLPNSTHSDAKSMESLFLLSSSLWASLWMVLSLLMMSATLWCTRK